MAAIDLPAPTVPDFDLSIAGRSAVADHEMVCEPVLHPAKMAVVIIECGRVALASSAVVNNDKLPATTRHRRTIDLIFHRASEITIARAAAGAASAAK